MYYLFEIILLAIGLSMDSLAVSVTGGAVLKRYSAGNLFRIGLVMALFQAGMTVGGYFCGMAFLSFIQDYDHWIAFALLLYLGIKMIRESLQKDEEEENKPSIDLLSGKTLCSMGIATSIDALAVGTSLAIIKTPLVPLALIVGFVTFLLSSVGVYIGHKMGARINFKLDLIGGSILILIGLKILAEHLYYQI